METPVFFHPTNYICIILPHFSNENADKEMENDSDHSVTRIHKMLMLQVQITNCTYGERYVWGK